MIDINSADTSKVVPLVSQYLMMFGGIVVGIALIYIAINMLRSAKNPEAREEGMEGLMKVAIGATIVGSAVLITGFLVTLANNAGITLNTGGGGTTGGGYAPSDDSGSFVIRAIAGIIDAIPSTVLKIANATSGFKSLQELIFSVGDTGLPPFSTAEWQNLNALYIAISSFVGPFLLIMVGKTGIEYLASIGIAKKVDLKEEILHWFVCISLIATAPFLVQGLVRFCNLITEVFVKATANMWGASNSPMLNKDSILKITTGNVLTTAIVHFLFAWKYIEINLIFMTRKITISVMYAFTPIAIALWGINRKVHAFPIWFGEMLTNSAMQFFYALTITVIMVGLKAVGPDNWVYSLICMFALVKVAEVLRNTLQGFFARLSGIDEAGIAKGAMGSVGGIVGGAAAAFAAGSGKSNPFKGGSVEGSVFGGAMGHGSGGGGGTGGGGTSGGGGSTKGPGPGPDPGTGPKGIDNPPIGTTDNTTTGDTTQPNGLESASKDDKPDFNGSENVPFDKGAMTDGEFGKFKEKSSEQGLYNNMLADNMNKSMSGKANIGGALTGIAKAATMMDKSFGGFAEGIGNIATGIQNRAHVGMAVANTVKQMRQLSGTHELRDKNGEIRKDKKGNTKTAYNMSTGEAMKKLFGGSDFLKSSFRSMRFVSAASKGNYGKAAKILAKAHPFNNLPERQKNAIIAQNNPYTSIDGFRNWRM